MFFIYFIQNDKKVNSWNKNLVFKLNTYTIEMIIKNLTTFLNHDHF